MNCAVCDKHRTKEGLPALPEKFGDRNFWLWDKSRKASASDMKEVTQILKTAIKS